MKLVKDFNELERYPYCGHGVSSPEEQNAHDDAFSRRGFPVVSVGDDENINLYRNFNSLTAS